MVRFRQQWDPYNTLAMLQQKTPWVRLFMELESRSNTAHVLEDAPSVDVETADLETTFGMSDSTVPGNNQTGKQQHCNDGESRVVHPGTRA